MSQRAKVCMSGRLRTTDASVRRDETRLVTEKHCSVLTINNKRRRRRFLSVDEGPLRDSSSTFLLNLIKLAYNASRQPWTLADLDKETFDLWKGQKLVSMLWCSIRINYHTDVWQALNHPISYRGKVTSKKMHKRATYSHWCQHLKTWLFRKSHPDLVIWTTISVNTVRLFHFNW